MKQLQDNQIDLRDLFAMAWRRRLVLLGVAAVILLADIAYCVLATPQYESTSTIQVLNEAPNGLGSTGAFGSPFSGSDSQSAPIVDKTEASILTSDSLASATIQKLHLDSRWPAPKPSHGLLGFLHPAPPVAPAMAREQANLQNFHNHLSVQPVSGTRLIAISYTDPDPTVAAEVVNSLSQSLMTFSADAKRDATASASTWLNSQLSGLRNQSEALQAKVVQLQQQSGVYGIAAGDPAGHDASYSGLLDQLQQATQALAQAEQNRILKGAIEHIAETGNADALSGLGGSSLGGAGTGASLGLIQNLRDQQATLQADVAQLETRYGSAYPRLIEDRQKLQSINAAIQAEITRVRSRANTDYQIAVAGEDAARTHYDELKNSAGQANSKAIEYSIAREDAARSRTLYEDLERRLNEANIGAEMKSSNIAVIDPGLVPSRPKSPNVPVLLLGGLLGALFVGLCSVFALESADTKVHRCGDVQEATGQGCKFILPPMQKGSDDEAEPIILAHPDAPFPETVRSMRTVLGSMSLPHTSKVLLVTSSVAGEGTSTVASNLAISFALDGSKVLLVDAGMRQGRLSSRLGLQDEVGMSGLLEHRGSKPKLHTLEQVPELKVLSSGPVPKNPAELLDSAEMRSCIEAWRSTYDVILIAGAPTLNTTDSVILSGLADATLFVVRAGRSDRNQLRKAFSSLKETGFDHSHLYTVLNAAHA